MAETFLQHDIIFIKYIVFWQDIHAYHGATALARTQVVYSWKAVQEHKAASVQTLVRPLSLYDGPASLVSSPGLPLTHCCTGMWENEQGCSAEVNTGSFSSLAIPILDTHYLPGF